MGGCHSLKPLPGTSSNHSKSFNLRIASRMPNDKVMERVPEMKETTGRIVTTLTIDPEVANVETARRIAQTTLIENHAPRGWLVQVTPGCTGWRSKRVTGRCVPISTVSALTNLPRRRTSRMTPSSRPKYSKSASWLLRQERQTSQNAETSKT